MTALRRLLDPDHSHMVSLGGTEGDVLSTSNPVLVHCYEAECGRDEAKLTPDAARAVEQVMGYR